MVAGPQLKNQSIIPERFFEDFCDDDDGIETPIVTPQKIIQSLESAIQSDTNELDTLVTQPGASHSDGSSIKVVKEFAAKRLGF